MKIVAGMPARWAARATPWAWLPAEAGTTAGGTARSSRVRSTAKVHPHTHRHPANGPTQRGGYQGNNSSRPRAAKAARPQAQADQPPPQCPGRHRHPPNADKVVFAAGKAEKKIADRHTG